MSSNSKRPGACVEDRISALPEEILFHVLSLLSTIEAVNTSALSKRWKNIWASLSNLDFSEFKFRKGFTMLTERFLDFVERVLMFRDSKNIHRFRLQCSGGDLLDLIDASCLARWIYTAVRRNVAELDLSLGSYNPYQQQFATVFRRPPVLELPKSLFRCTTLVRFKLLMDQKLHANNAPPTSNGFPSLKFLHLTLHYAQPYSIEKLISCCGALEDLTIDGDIGIANSNLNMSAPKVKRLQLGLVLDQQSSSEINCIWRTSIDANVPSLEELDICYEFLVLGSNNTGFTRWPDLAGTGFQCLPPAFSNLKSLELQLKTCYCCRSLMNFGD